MTLIVVFTILIAVAVTLGVYATWAQTAAEKNPMVVRLRQLRSMHLSTPRLGYGERPPLVLDLIARLGGFLPAREGRNALRTGLVRAGYRSPQAMMVFLGSKVALACLLPLFWIVYATLTAKALGNAVVLTAVWAALG